MPLLRSIAFGCALLAVGAAASNAHVFLLDPANSPASRPRHHETVSPSVARLLFAERLSLSHYYDVLDADEEVLRILNTHMGAPVQLPLVNNQKADGSRVLIVVDGVESALELVPDSPGISFFDIAPAPHPFQTSRLVTDLISYAKKSSSASTTQPALEAVLREMSQKDGDSLVHFDHQYILRIQSLSEIGATEGTRSEKYKDYVTALRQAFESLANLASGEPIVATVVLMPLEHHCAKRSDDLYRLGSLVSRQVPEELLSEGGNVGKSKSSPTSDHQPASTSSSVFLGPVPTCFTSKTACESRTNNCTGHGECRLRSAEKQGDIRRDCYNCVCTKPETRKTPTGGQKTTYFGGAACQKKDVVMPFWLLTGVTVFIVFIISWGVGLLYSMGNEDLPSVIGAGVSGPKAK